MAKRGTVLVVAGFLFGVCSCAFGVNIVETKLLADGSPVTLVSKAVTYAETNFFYIQEDTVVCGIRVVDPGHGIEVGMRADVQGVMQTNPHMERYIAATSTTHNGDDSLAPIYINNKSLGGSDWHYDADIGSGQKGTTGIDGANNTGLLVRTSGRFQLVDAGTFTIDDGGEIAIRCVAPSEFLLYPGAEFVTVTGISSMYDSGGGTLRPTILVREVGPILAVESVAFPGKPTGVSAPLANGTYTYSTTGSQCSDDHPIEYRFNWGDGTTSSWLMSKNATHSWSQTGSKAVTVTARCQTHPNLTATSQTLTVDVQNELLCEMVGVPVGSFLMGNTGSEPYSLSNENPQHTVTISTFSVGKFEVTRAQYQRFINSGGYSNPVYWSADGWNWRMSENRTQPLHWNAQQNWGSPPGTFTQTDTSPAVGVSYYEAEAFCTWAGGRLPTEAEWEKAARWMGAQPNIYPWGNIWDEQKCNNQSDTLYAMYRTSPVGSYPAGGSPYGCQDMAGNVWEWCKDWYLTNYYSQTPTGGWVNPQGPSDGRYRVLRGGSWGTSSSFVRCATRICDIPESSWYGSGFRFASSAAPSDTQPPSVPTNVQATALSATTVSLTWTASTDNLSVAGYKIYRNGAQVGIATTTSYSDAGLSPATTYSYKVSAHDSAGNNSSQSSPPAVVTTQSGVGISNLVPSNYRIVTWDIGSMIFIDRTYPITVMPEKYRGMIGIQTANNDKDNPSLDFHFTINQTADVYVCLQDPLQPTTPLLSGFVDTGDNIIANEAFLTTHSVFRKTYPAGVVSLGPKPGAGDQRSMYFVLAEPTGG